MSDQVSRYEDRVRQWPYAVRQLFQSPTAELIESHAVAFACRALNIGRVTAFVGSGASMAYGRISWNDLIYVAQTAVLRRYRAHQADLERRPEHHAQLKRIIALLETHKIERSGRLTAMQQLTIFQVAEQADRIMTRLLGDRRETLRDTIMWLTYDDRGHAEELLIDAVLDSVVEEEDDDGVRDECARQALRRALWGDERELGDARQRGQLTLRRVRTGSALAALADPTTRYRAAAWLRRQPEKDRLSLIEASLEDAGPDANDATRRGALRPARDPLSIVLKDLRITRFLTTNYDHEVERLAKQQGYHHRRQAGSSPTSPPAGLDPLAESYRDVVFTHETTGELVALAAGDRSRGVWVVHLHGRAELDGRGQIIATEEDYRDRYVRTGEPRFLIDDSVRLAFGASPILFLGIGMDEIDLLRPLRQFMSSPARVGDRVVLALLPTHKSPEETERQKIDLLQRYGVYAIHFGNWTSGGDAASPCPWLPVMVAIRDAVDGALRPFCEPSEFRQARRTATAWRAFVATWWDRARAELAVIDRLHDDDRSRPNGHRLFVPSAQPRRLIPPVAIDGTVLTAAQGLTVDVEIEELNGAVSFVFELERWLAAEASAVDSAAPPTGGPDWSQVRRDGQAHRVLIAGALTGLTTVCLCARLLRLRGEWQQWRDEWRRLPAERTPWLNVEQAVDCPLPESGSIRLTAVRRHQVELPLRPETDDNTPHRFYAGAPSRTFNALMTALENHRPSLATFADRRTFLVVARRGAGKGHFFAALQQPITERREGEQWMPRAGRLAHFLHAISPRVSEYACGFFNLSFSLEITSVFDRIVELLWAFLPGDVRRREAANRQGLRKDRIHGLRFVLSLYTPAAVGVGRRVLLAFNGISVMFDRQGKPKNRQFGILFDALLDQRFQSAPIDLLFVASDVAVPAEFRARITRRGRRVISPERALRLLVPPLTAKDRARVFQDSADLCVEEADRQAVLDAGADIGGAPTGRYVHFMRQARASVVVSAFFPSVALLIGRRVMNRHVERATSESEPLRHWLAGRADPDALLANVFHPLTARDLRISVKDHLGAPDECWLRDHDTLVFPGLMLAAVLGFEGRTTNLGEVARRLGREAPRITAETDLWRVLCEAVGLLEGITSGEATDRIVASFKAVTADVDDAMRQIYTAVGAKRFALTLLLATTYESVYPAIPRSTRDTRRGIPRNQFESHLAPIAERAMRFLFELCTEVEGLRSPRRDDVVIARALAEIQRRHEEISREGADPPPRAATLGPLTIETPPELKQGIELYGVQQWILWHLAVMCVPVEADVLARCPLLRGAIDAARRPPRPGAPPRAAFTDAEYERFVETILKLLTVRCLVFRLKPYPGLDKERFSIHRSLQRHIFQKMGAPFVEYPEVDRFSLTLYASQPNDVPKLSLASHDDLRRTVWALSGYPDDEQVGAAYDSITPNDQNLRTRMLRAAYAILRSIYSLASLARIDVGREGVDRASRPEGPPRSPGFFEEHRLQVFWLLRQAARLPALHGEDVAPFYAEEIVWLYNECGVLSLTQGRLPDAVALFEMANKAAERLEPSDTGPLRTLVLLNRSIAEIERGRVASARRTLQAIDGLTGHGHDPEVHLIARGYLGLIHHLTGHAKEAVEAYEQIVPALRELGKSRAASIFARHHGDLLRSMGPDAYDAARAHLDMAVQLSLEDNHEDTRHLALLAQARLKLLDPRRSHSSEVHAILDGTERYAEVMGMPRLTSEIHEIRARLHRDNGDLKTAGSVATDSLELAALHELRIRKAKVLTLLAQINLERNDTRSAQALLDEALVIIRDTGYNAAAKSAQELTHDIRARHTLDPF